MAKNGFIGEILHFNAFRARVTGSGNLKVALKSLDNVDSQQLTAIPMSTTTAREPTILANFISQRAQWEVKTTEIDEVFTISRIIVFVAPKLGEYPR